MKKIIFLTMLLFIGTSIGAIAQISGTQTIPGNYPSIADAIADLNVQGVGPGGVTFDVAAGHTETFATDVTGVITATGTVANQIIFQKSGVGANPIITSGLGTVVSSTSLTAYGDGIIIIEGGDYITFDGIDLQENPAAASTSVEKMEFGYFLKKASGDDACKNVTIKNCTITLDKTTRYSWGIYVSNFVGTTSVTVTSIGGRHENIKIFNNNISNVYGGIHLRGFIATGNLDLYDHNIEVGVDGANTITNFGGGISIAYGFYAIYQNNLKIANNTINGGAGTTTTLYGIFTSTGTNSNVDIYNNTLTIEGGGTTSTIYAINNAMGGTGTTNDVNIYNNIVENCTYPTVTSGTMYGLYNTASAFNVNMYGNTVRNNSKGGTSGAMYLIYNSSTGVNGFSNIYNNTLHGNTNGAATGDLFCLYSNEVATSTKMVYGNTIYNNTGGDDVHGINSLTGVLAHIHGNHIYDITTTTALTTSPYNSGITIGSGTEVYVYNNLISDLKAPNCEAVDAVRGISIITTSTNATRGIYNNTIYLNASSSGTNFGSSGIFHIFSTTATTSTLDMRNNNIVNNSTPNGTGYTVAFRRSAATNLNNYAEISNNNNFYAGTPGVSNLLFYDGTNEIQTMGDLKLLVAPRESASVTGLPPFVNISTTPYDLHINPASPTQLESAGTPITTPIAVTLDYDGDTRNVLTPDIGADEFNGIAADLSPPDIFYTQLNNTSSTGNRSLTVTITDPSGIQTGANGPRLYYRISTDPSYIFDNNPVILGDEYTFTINSASLGGVSSGTIIEYYVAAQDMVDNVGTNPSGGSGVNPPGTTPPPAPNSYTIVPGISGTFTVGTTGDYLNLTAIANLLNNPTVEVNGNLIFELQNDYDGSVGETLPIVFNEFLNAGSGGTPYTVTIRPALGVTGRVTSGDPGSNFAFPVINFVGGKHFIFDGRPGGVGTSKEWTIRNTRAVATIGSVIRFADDGAYNTLQYLNLESQATLTTTGIVFFHTSTGSIGNSYNSILNNNFQPRTDVATPSFSNGILSNGSAAAPNTGNTVSDNHFINFNNIGISLLTTNTGNGPDWVITGNHFYNPTHSSSAAQTGVSVASAAVTNTLISGNFIGGSGPNATGTMTNTGTGIVTGILVSNGIVTIEENTIANIAHTGTGTGARLRGIYLTSGNDGNEIIDNHIFNLSASSTGVGLGAGVQPVAGISIWSGATFFNTTVTGNLIHDIVAENTFANITSNVPCGMFLTNVGAGSIVANNMIYDIKNKATGTTANQPPIAAGIFIRFIENPEIYNNMISLGFSENTNTQFSGIMVVAGAVTNINQYVHNSIAIGGISSGSNNSFGILRGDNTAVSIGSPVNLYNNAVANTRSGGGSLNFAVGSQGSNATLNLNSNYNVFYSSDANTIGLLDGTSYTFDGWKIATSGDANSISSDPLFVSATDLTPSLGSPVIGAGTPISYVTTDIIGDTRDGTAPSIGAYEEGDFNGFVYQGGLWTPSDPMTNAGPTDDVMIVDGTATFNADMNINNLTVNTGATLNIENVLKANGNIENNGSIVFVSNATTTGQLDTFTGNITGSGLVTAQRYIPARRAFRLLSSAVNTSTSIRANLQEGVNNPDTATNLDPNPTFGTHITGSATGLNGFDATPSGNPSIFMFDNIAQNWGALPNTDALTLNAGGAIRLMVRGDRSINVNSNAAPATNTTLRATGTLVTGTQIQAALSSVAGDFNFFGNPYQAVVDMNGVITGSANINSNFYYVWDPTLAGTNGRGAYVTVDLPAGTNASGSAANQYLQPSQAAFVSTLANAPASLTFQESNKAVTQPQTSVFSITSKLDVRVYEATAFANNEKAADGLRLKFTSDGNNAITSLDALKLYNLDENLATSQNGKLYSIESRALPQIGEIIGLFTNQYRSTGYVFEADLTALEDVTAYLRDNYTGTETELANNALTLYSFNVDPNNPNSISPDRFEIIFQEITMDVNDEIFGSGFVLFPNPARDNVFFIATNGLEGQNVTIRINNVLGQQVVVESLQVSSNGRLQINTPGLPAGVYVVTLTDKDGKSFTAKLINK